MIGAVSPRPSSPTIPDPEVAAFAAEAAADDGLVLVSFGSVSSFFGTLLTWDDYTGLSAAFADLAPVRVLWLLHPAALGNRTVDELPLGANTMVVPWGPINDVLGHPSCRAFVTHGGERARADNAQPRAMGQAQAPSAWRACVARAALQINGQPQKQMNGQM